MSNIFSGVVPVASGTIPGTVPSNPERLTDGSTAASTDIPLQVVVAGTYHGYWTMDLGAPGSVTTLSVNVVGAAFGALSLESSTDGMSWDSVVAASDWAAGASGDTSTVSPFMNNTSREYWRLVYTATAPGLSAIGGVSVRELSVDVGSLTSDLIADFSADVLSGQAPLEVTFTDLTTGSPTSWAWDFGDSGTTTSQNPVHTYTDPGLYTVSLTADDGVDSDTATKVAYILVTGPGGSVEFDDAFVDISHDIKEWTITRGSGPELTGGSQPGSAVIVLRNLSDQYNPENVSGPYYGFLHDGPRVWIGVNEDGTVAFDPDKDVYGLFAGRITDLSLLPVGGAMVAPTVEMVCEDPLGWYARAQVNVLADTTRSQKDLRVAVLDDIDDVGLRSLESEPTTLPLSSADGLGLNVLDAINAANGTRHFAKPADNPTDWVYYTTIRRTSRLDGVAEASADAGSEHVTSTTGWRVSADGVINRQKASVEPILFPAIRDVWTADTLPLIVTTSQDIWVEFGDYVRDPVVAYESSGSALTATLTSFGATAKLTLSSAGATTVTALAIRGRLVQRGSIESVVVDDPTSQALARGVRAGPDLTGDYLGTLTSAKGFAAHIVWRFGNAQYRPTMTVLNWFPQMFDLDLYDRIALTIAELSITDRIFEIVGLQLHCDLAALDADDNPVVLHEATYTLQESRVQTPTQWFTLDVSELDGSDLLAY